MKFGFVEHNSTRITRGGDNGRPLIFGMIH